MKVTVSNTLAVENPTSEVMMWCKKNLTLPNPDYAKKARMGFWTGNTPRTLSLYEENGNQLILPFGVLKTVPAIIWQSAEFTADFEPAKAVNFNAEVPLYDYQEDAVQAMIEAKYGILQSAAGSGKTQMGIALATRLGVKTLWLCHTLDLVRQSKERAELYMSKNLMGFIKEGKVDIG